MRNQRIVDIRHDDDGQFLVTSEEGDTVNARHVILAFGYHDIHPAIRGFAESWGDTIIPCPFCDGYENRDRTWAIVGTTAEEISSFPLMARNWTSQIKVILATDAELEEAYSVQLGELGIPVHRGAITEVHHSDGKVHAVNPRQR